MLLTTMCPVCRRPGPAPCAACAALLSPAPQLTAPEGIDRWVALVAYDDASRPLVLALKRNHRDALHRLAGALAVVAAPLGAHVVTWPPTTGERRRERGYDQAELLARAVARRLHRPARRLLRRSGGPQAGLDRAHRLAGPTLVARRRVGAGTVLVVDDVSTTGATLAAAAAALRHGGAAQVVAAVVAARP